MELVIWKCDKCGATWHAALDAQGVEVGLALRSPLGDAGRGHVRVERAGWLAGHVEQGGAGRGPAPEALHELGLIDGLRAIRYIGPIRPKAPGGLSVHDMFLLTAEQLAEEEKRYGKTRK
jgi:hypothetical protein